MAEIVNFNTLKRRQKRAVRKKNRLSGSTGMVYPYIEWLIQAAALVESICGILDEAAKDLAQEIGLDFSRFHTQKESFEDLVAELLKASHPSKHISPISFKPDPEAPLSLFYEWRAPDETYYSIEAWVEEIQLCNDLINSLSYAEKVTPDGKTYGYSTVDHQFIELHSEDLGLGQDLHEDLCPELTTILYSATPESLFLSAALDEIGYLSLKEYQWLYARCQKLYNVFDSLFPSLRITFETGPAELEIDNEFEGMLLPAYSLHSGYAVTFENECFVLYQYISSLNSLTPESPDAWPDIHLRCVGTTEKPATIKACLRRLCNRFPNNKDKPFFVIPLSFNAWTEGETAADLQKNIHIYGKSRELTKREHENLLAAQNALPSLLGK